MPGSGAAGPNLGLKYGWVAHEAGWGTPFNDNFAELDAITFLQIKSATLATPPGSPAAGDRYVVAASPTGAWSGHSKDLAIYRASAWAFYTPKAGWRAYNEATSSYIRFDGTNWISETAEAATPTQANTGFSSWLNQPTSSTVADSPVGLTVFKPAQASPSLALLQKTPPSTPYSFKGLITATTPLSVPSGTGKYGGVLFGFSDGTKSVGIQFNFGITTSPGLGWQLNVTRYSAFSSYTATIMAGSYYPLHSPLSVKIQDDGTNLKFYYSNDMENFVQLYSEARGSYLSSPTKIVFGAFDFTNTLDTYATLTAFG